MNNKANLFILTAANFRSEVLESEKPVLVVFEADWSGGSDIMRPILEEVSSDFKEQVKIGTLDIDANKTISNEYGITHLPTLIFFNNGKAIDHIVGTVPKRIIVSKLNTLLKLTQINL
jgi:thioredoxin 1